MAQDRNDLPRREREIMNILFSGKEATSARIRGLLTNAPTGNAVRATLQILEDKGLIVRAKKVGREFVYQPKENTARAGLRALRGVLETFFEGSLATALATQLTKGEEIDEEEYARLKKLVEMDRGSAAAGSESGNGKAEESRRLGEK